MDEKKYQVFISSTYTDLISARAKVSEQILTMYHFPIGMEMFSAGNDDQWTVITNTIDKSDYYVIILGNRYGSLAEDGVSYTEKEYDYAKSNGIPIMAFIKDRNIPTAPSERESDLEIIKKLDNFIEKAKQNKMCNFWKNEDELSAQVTAALYKAFYSTPRIGWIRADTIDTAKTLGEITALSAENRKLKEELEELRKLRDEKVPELEVTLNNLTYLEVPYKSDIRVKKLDTLRPIAYELIPSHLLKLVSETDVEQYNSKIPEVNKDIDSYNLEIEKYTLTKEQGIECNIELTNNGKSKATNIYVDIEFPQDILIVEGSMEDLEVPSKPKLPKNPVKEAERKYNTPFDMTRYAGMPGIAGLSGINGVLGSYNTIAPSYLNYDKDNFVNFKENDATVRCKSLIHTRRRTFDEKFIIVPLKSGVFEVKVDIICEEYSEPKSSVITINANETFIETPSQ